ncbi:hypothetical protein POVWA2_049300 [Plasmodium ovale wallikeri]|uniref:Uncharacterized protein n=1 Tax=Plasmodium ovale wallikeri TaxID=864142 RepID=A0A1A8ZMP2_PLAOA|nr:hypothetical protein POVWA2_049300 [Plasmodium ovale wallikeri]
MPSLLCHRCCAIAAMPSLLCHRCYAIAAVTSLLCHRCHVFNGNTKRGNNVGCTKVAKKSGWAKGRCEK